MNTQRSSPPLPLGAAADGLSFSSATAILSSACFVLGAARYSWRSIQSAGWKAGSVVRLSATAPYRSIAEKLAQKSRSVHASQTVKDAYLTPENLSYRCESLSCLKSSRPIVTQALNHARRYC